MNYISQANVGGTTYAIGLPNIYINDKGNFNIETSSEIGNTSRGKINIEAMDDIQLKPGDDIVLYSHHRAEDKLDEVAVKVTDGDDVPVKLQLNAAEVVLTTKDKTGNNADVMDVTVNAAQNTRGYLKLRAQAIDLRSETHGGIALQPKGFDSDSHMNKIKFEHGGGDGLEFGTFNTEKTSIFTDEYRFNKDGVWKMATRVTEASDKADSNDATTALKYVKQADDFYDVISQNDATATTENIIKTAYAFNGKEGVQTKITSKGNLEISSTASWRIVSSTDLETADADIAIYGCDQDSLDAFQAIIDAGLFTLKDFLDAAGDNLTDAPPSIDKDFSFAFTSEASGRPGIYAYGCEPLYDTPSINIESDSTIKLKGTLDFGSTFGFGETDGGIETQYKKTKKNAVKDCGVLKVVAVNNSSSAWTLATDGLENLKTPANTSISAGSSEVIAECSIYDIIKLVNYMKDNNEGPWTQPAVTP